MSTLKFAKTHNMIAFLSKPSKSERFEKIIDFINAKPIKYALTVNHTVYTSCIEQFWTTAKAKNINEEAQIHAKVDGKKVIISEASIKRDLRFGDEGGIDCFLNEVIFEQLTLIGILNDKESLGEDDASKEGWISDIDANQDIYLVNVHKDEDIFSVNDQDDTLIFNANKDLQSEEVVVEKEVGKDVSAIEEVNAASIATSVTAITTTAATTPTISMDEITLAKALTEIKTSRPKAKRIVMQEPRERARKEEEANGALIETWEDIQEKVDANYQLVERLQAEEQEQLTDAEKAKLFMEFMKKRRKFFAAKRTAKKGTNHLPKLNKGVL
nr:hypothetical protein [Tanacetum cinerariifolium]